ncbi:MAG: hypothetical protein ACK4TC_07355 [Sphingomonas pseudosanguinis]|uniref:hypothetical protein n=1 Tax=Sphingomonas pseudosanguinis TaxID=413712 RepID=UPI00391C91DF
MEAIVHRHSPDLSARVHRWRAAPHALPIIVRDHHAARSGDPILPPDPEHHDDGPSGAFLGLLCAALVYIAAGIAIGLRASGRI